MKKRILFCCAVLLMLCTLTTCERQILTDEAQVDGNFIVSVLQLEQTPFNSRTRAEAVEACTRMNFAVYDTDGTRLKQVNQTASDKNFGTAGFQLEEGTYQAVIVGHSSGGNPTMTDPTCIKFTNSQGFSDTFLYTTTFTVADEPIYQPITLNRIVSLCRFVITDAVPAEVKTMRFYYTGGSGAFDANTGFGCVNSKQDVKCDVGGGLKQFDLYTFLHDTEGTIHLTVTALDSSGNELYNREFDVQMRQNYITWVNCAYFTGSGASSSVTTGVSFNTDWAGETHVTF